MILSIDQSGQKYKLVDYGKLTYVVISEPIPPKGNQITINYILRDSIEIYQFITPEIKSQWLTDLNLHKAKM